MDLGSAASATESEDLLDKMGRRDFTAELTGVGVHTNGDNQTTVRFQVSIRSEATLRIAVPSHNIGRRGIHALSSTHGGNTTEDPCDAEVRPNSDCAGVYGL